MMTATPRLVAILLVFSLVIPGSAVAAGTAAGVNPNDCISAEETKSTTSVSASVIQPQNTTDTIRIAYDLERDGPQFHVDLPTASEVVSKRGFSEKSDSKYVYNGSSDPFIEYRILNDFPRWMPVGTDEWIFAPKPDHSGISVDYAARPNGVVSDRFIYIGNYTSLSATDGCHTVTLVVSESSKSEIDEENIHDSLIYTAEEIDIGHRYEQVTIFAVPRAPDPRYGGAAKRNEAWFKATQDSQNNSLKAIHEYLHTRSVLDGTGIGGMLWFTEGSINYLAFQMGYERGDITAATFNGLLIEGSEENAVLTNHSTWDSSYTKYSRGTAFVAILDYKLRSATNGSYSIEDMLRQINNIQTDIGVVNIQRERFLDRIENNSNQSVRYWANKSIDSSENFEYEQAKFEPRYLEHYKNKIAERSGEQPINTLFVWIWIGFVTGILVAEKLNTGRENSELADSDPDESDQHPNRVS